MRRLNSEDDKRIQNSDPNVEKRDLLSEERKDKVQSELKSFIKEEQKEDPFSEEKKRVWREVMGIIKRKQEEERREEEPLRVLPYDRITPEDLSKIAEERSRLVLISKSASEIKTLCFQPKINRRQGIETCKFKSIPIKEDGNSPLKKIDVEIRTRIENTSIFPYSVHGVVRVDLGEGKYKTGTGILIGPDLVLTAAHNIYDYRRTKEKYSKIEFIPGINEQIIPFGVYKVVDSYAPPEFEETCEKEDYALLVLDETAGIVSGYFGLHIASKEILKGKELNVFGYPGYVRTKDEKNTLVMLSGTGRHQLWGMKGKSWHFCDKDENSGDFLINYEDILTTPGQSGSGLFYQVEGTNEYYVIGVHVAGGEGYNSATWITRERFLQIEKWVGESRKKLIRGKIESERKEKTDKIKFLYLSFRQIGDIGIEVIVEYAMRSLTTLFLVRNNIGDEGATGLGKNVSWTNLTTLNLERNKIGAEGATGLGKNVSWTNLTTLDLSYNNIGAEGATGLGKNDSWTNLTALNLAWNYIGDEGATELGKNVSWTNLTTLNLEGNNIGAEGATGLGKNDSWTNLTTLFVTKNYIGDEGATGLGKNDSWTNLTTLSLAGNFIGDEGATGLGKNDSWTDLTTLFLHLNNIGDEGATGLGKNVSWTNLTTLNLAWTNIGDEGAIAIRKRWPGIYVLAV